MKKLLTMMMVCLWSSTVSAQNLLLDPSFDASTPASQTNPEWTLDVSDDAGVAAQYQDAPWASNPNGTPGVGVWLRAFTGSAGGSLANATLYQDVSAPAGMYDLSFFFKNEANYSAESTIVELLEDGSRIGVIDLTEADTGGAFEEFSFGSVSNGGTLRVQARMINGFDAGANPQSAMFDDFSLMAVPEPSSFLLLTFGFVGLVLRRSR